MKSKDSYGFDVSPVVLLERRQNGRRCHNGCRSVGVKRGIHVAGKNHFDLRLLTIFNQTCLLRKITFVFARTVTSRGSHRLTEPGQVQGILPGIAITEGFSLSYARFEALLEKILKDGTNENRRYCKYCKIIMKSPVEVHKDGLHLAACLGVC